MSLNSKEILDNQLKAIDILIQKRLQDSQFNITIVGTIVNTDEMFSGKYSVNYNNIVLTAYSDGFLYSLKDEVYICVPNGDFSNQLFILGKKR